MSGDDRAVRIGVVGATGAVGEVLLDVLGQRDYPVAELRPLASGRSAGSKVQFRGAPVEVCEARPAAFDGLDVVFFAATGSLSKELAPEVAKRGGIAIDKSNTWRMEDGVPLVVPEVNPDAVDGHSGIIAAPNCTTIGCVMALEPIHRAAGLKSAVRSARSAQSSAPAKSPRRSCSQHRSPTTSCRSARPFATTATPPKK